MGKITDVSLRERMIHKSIEAMLKKEHPDNYKEFIISPSFLRCEKALVDNQAKYTFDLKKIGGEVATEVKLDRNDLFVVTRIGLFLSLQAPTTIGKEVVQSYPNATVFTATGLVAADLEVIYNGFSSLKIGNRVNIENLSNHEFRYAPDTQQSSATTKSSFTTSDATYKPASLISLHGTMDIVYTVEFPTYAGIRIQSDAGQSQTKLVLIPYGFLIKGAANKK